MTGRIHSPVVEAVRVYVSDADVKTFIIDGESEQNVTFNYAVSIEMFINRFVNIARVLPSQESEWPFTYVC